MKKRVILLTVISFLFIVGGAVLFYFLPDIMGASALFNKAKLHDVKAVWDVFASFFSGTFPFVTVLSLSFLAVCLVLLVIQIVMIFKSKRGVAILQSLAFVILSAASVYCLIVLFTADFLSGLPLGAATAIPYAEPGGYITFVLGYYRAAAINVGWVILSLTPVLLLAIGILLAFIGMFVDCVYLGRVAAKRKVNGKQKDSAKRDGVIVVHESGADPSSPVAAVASDIRAGKKEGAVDASLAVPAAEEEFAPYAPQSPYGGLPVGGNAVSGPFLVQYINAYSPTSKGTPVTNELAKKEEGATDAEIPENVAVGKALTADDVRRIIREEIGEKKENSEPVNVISPARAKAEAKETKALTADDVRAILLEGLTARKEEDIIVEPVNEPTLTADEIRSLIASELSKNKEEQNAPQPVLPSPAPIKEEDVRAAIRDELTAFHRTQEEEKEKAKAEQEALKAEADDQLKDEEGASVKKEAAHGLTVEDIRAIIIEEFTRLFREERSEEEAMSPATVRALIREEVGKIKPIVEETVAPVSVLIREVEVAPTPAVEEKPNLIATPIEASVTRVVVEDKEEEKDEEPIGEEATPEPEPQPEPALPDEEEEPAAKGEEPVEEREEVLVEEEDTATEEETEPEPPPLSAPLSQQKRPVGAFNPDLPPHDKIIRIPFSERMKSAEPELKRNYNELKSEIMSYGVKCRTSNSGDTFRLHKVTYIKLTIAGKGLKLYMALDPQDYANTTFPVQDASDKKVYEAIPLVFKVKSDLSVKRAKQLIAAAFAKAGLPQGEVISRPWADELHDEGEDEDFEGEEE